MFLTHFKEDQAKLRWERTLPDMAHFWQTSVTPYADGHGQAVAGSATFPSTELVGLPVQGSWGEGGWGEKHWGGLAEQQAGPG